MLPICRLCGRERILGLDSSIGLQLQRINRAAAGRHFADRRNAFEPLEPASLLSTQQSFDTLHGTHQDGVATRRMPCVRTAQQLSVISDYLVRSVVEP